MMESKPLEVDLAFSHMGFYVRDLDAMARFYREALRFTVTDRGLMGGVELVFLSREPAEHHQIVLVSGRPQTLPFNVINQVSFRVPDLAALRRYHARVLAGGATDMQAVTHGNSVSFYCRDPEGNRLEVFMDTPWYCEQPLRQPLDLAQDDALILQQAEVIARARPGFQPRSEWLAAMRERMRADQRAR
ncbi:VOC family protein [Bordetella trematum]|uniref:VOC family protein n=1 Tax=Bordetella trematum TaxID=123899 RepID=UPI0015587B7A|nr:VOC family protein [Bordetella trematum]